MHGVSYSMSSMAGMAEWLIEGSIVEVLVKGERTRWNEQI